MKRNVAAAEVVRAAAAKEKTLKGGASDILGASSLRV
jgi:hypothetical protein